DVDPVGTQLFQASLDLAHDMRAGEALVVRAGADPGEDLAGDHEAVALAFDRLAKQSLRLSLAVVVGAVDEIAALVDGALDRSDKAFFVQGAAHARAQADRRDLHAGLAESAILHKRSPKDERFSTDRTDVERI